MWNIATLIFVPRARWMIVGSGLAASVHLRSCGDVHTLVTNVDTHGKSPSAVLPHGSDMLIKAGQLRQETFRPFRYGSTSESAQRARCAESCCLFGNAFQFHDCAFARACIGGQCQPTCRRVCRHWNMSPCACMHAFTRIWTCVWTCQQTCK